ncbi:MAG: amino acid adenylation domain-containing protein, partial [Candidatus Aminicenantes bacterium]|nr:amino acid adenylation domain-containing protein [Candidatus Aminicenantes bacterium]
MKIKDLVPGIKILSNRENLEQITGMIEDHYRMQLGGGISKVQVDDWGISVYSQVSVDSMWNHLAVLPGSENFLLPNLAKIENFAIKNRRFPSVYITAELSTADQLAAVLNQANYEALKIESWMVFRDKGALTEPEHGSLEIKQVETEFELEDFVDIFNDSYAPGQVYMGDVLKSQFYSQAFSNVRHFIGYAGKTPVCIATAILGREGNVCIYNVGTIVAHRRKGYGAVITSYLINEFIQAGHKTLFLQADYRSGAERIYKRLGFEELFHRIGFIQSSCAIPAHEAESFWRSCLSNIKAPTKLPTEDVSTVHLSPSEDVRAVEYREMPAAVAASAEDFISKYGLTLDILLTGLCALLFSRYCNEETALLGLEYSKKKRDKYIFPMPITIDPFTDLELWFGSIAELKNRIEEYGVVPLPEIQDWSPIPDEYRLFDIVLEFTSGTRCAPLKEKRIYPLVCRFLLPKKAFEINYDRRFFSQDTVQRLTGQLLHLLEEIPQKTGLPPASLEIVTEREKREILFDFNDTYTEYPTDKFIHECFEEQAAKIPDQAAILGPTFWGLKQDGKASFPQSRRPGYLTYGELDRQAATLAKILINKGIKPGNIVGIMIQPSIEMIIGIFAVLKAGAAYLPISPEYPRARKKYILEDSGAAVLLTARTLFEEDGRFSGLDKETIFLDELSGPREEKEDSGVGAQDSVLADHDSSDLCYVIYTSGSTGKPKGVLVEHGAVVNLIFFLFADYPTTASDCYLFVTSYIFDVSVVELFCWFFGGSKLIIMGRDERKEPQNIIDKIESAKITHIDFAPSMFNAVLEELANYDAGKLSSLEYIFLAGEAVLPGLVNKYKKSGCTANLENLYGPTEAAVYASGYSLRDWNGQGSIPIGKPLYNVKLYILDEEGNVQPKGVPGELMISGAGVARGYLNNPELTAEKFINIASGGQLFKKSWTKTFDKGHGVISTHQPSNSLTHKLLYKTGDLASWLPDGNIEFLGRLDHQVKLRGQRIELGEIENYLLSHEMIREAVVIAGDNEAGEKYLCAYITVKDKAQRIESTDLREFLSQDLPGYMIPSFFVQ